MKAKQVTKRANFVSPNEKAKSAVVAQLARKARLGYDDFLYISQQARKKLGLRRGRKERRLPQLLADADLKRFFRAIHGLQRRAARDPTQTALLHRRAGERTRPHRGR